MKPLINQGSARKLEDFLAECDVFRDYVGVADGNNFFVSCERLFRPRLIGKPVVVTGNNNGCIIARSNEVKKLGLPMGVPAFKWEVFLKQHNVIVCEGRQSLYNHISERLMKALSLYTPVIQLYSVDEAFMSFAGMDYTNLYEYGRLIVDETTRNIGIPVALGMAPTKTLAKIADRFAKKYNGYNNLCIIDRPDKLVKALRLTHVEDIWGIGDQHKEKLHKAGVFTAYEFTQMPQAWIRKNFTVVGEKTWLELRGVKCIDIIEEEPDKKQICVSRTFERDFYKREEVKEAVASFASMCAHKLRDKGLFAKSLIVFLQTNYYKKDIPDLFLRKEIDLPAAANDDIEIIRNASKAFEEIYTSLPFKRAGVIISSITKEPFQGNIFYQKDYRKCDRLMKAVDMVNQRYGRNKLYIASRGEANKFFKKYPLPLLEINADA